MRRRIVSAKTTLPYQEEGSVNKIPWNNRLTAKNSDECSMEEPYMSERPRQRTKSNYTAAKIYLNSTKADEIKRFYKPPLNSNADYKPSISLNRRKSAKPRNQDLK